MAAVPAQHGSLRTDPAANAATVTDVEQIKQQLGDSFVESTITDDGIAVYVAQGAASSVSAIAGTLKGRLSAAGISLTITYVRYTEDQLQSLEKVIAHDPWLTTARIGLGKVGADPATGKLKIGLTKYSAAAADSVLAHYGSDSVDVLPGDYPSLRTISRTSDNWPWTGGDALTGCTSNFSFDDNSNSDYVALAGHCSGHSFGNQGTYDVTVETDDYKVISNYVIDRTLGDNRQDSELAPGLASPFVWNGSTRSLVSYVSQTDPNNGLICVDGANTGYICSVQIDDGTPACYSTYIDQNDPSQGTYLTCGLVEASKGFGDVIGVPGDSGGPVETPLNSTTTEARGMMIAVTDYGETVYYLPTRLLQHADHVEAEMPIRQVGLAQYCMTANSNTSGSAISIRACDGDANQIWNWGANGTIKADGKCLDVYHSTGPSIQLYTCNGTPAQVWRHRSGATNTQDYIVNQATGECLDDPYQSTTSGATLWVHTCNGTIAQYWSVPNQE